LIICCELCSITFQKNDHKKSNLIGTALFGDGVGAALMVGDQSPLSQHRITRTPRIKQTSSFTKKASLSAMGWDVTNSGLEVVFSKRIPTLVHSFWKEHVLNFLENSQLHIDNIHTFLAHPGGKKVLEAMEQSLNISREQLRYSYHVLMNHGNMSSVTVFYILL